MVPVVVHNPVVAGEVLGLEAAARARKGGQPARDARKVTAHLQRGSGRRQGVEHVVLAGYAQLHTPQRLAPVVDDVEGAPALHRQLRGGVVRILPAVGNAVRVAGADIGGTGVVLAVENLAARLAAQAVEHALDVVQVAVEVQVLGLDVQDDAVLRHIVHQGAVALIALRHQVLAVLVPVRVGAQHGYFRTHIVAGAEASLAHQVRGEGGGGRLAVRACYHHTLLVVQNRRQTFRTAQAEQVPFPRCLQCRVVLPYRAGVDDNLRMADGIRIVRAGESQTGGLQTLGLIARYAITAAHSVPHLQQHARQPAHAGSGYAD